MSKLPSVAFPNVNAYDNHIEAASKMYDVPFIVIKSIIAVESSFNPNAKASTTSASGLMQMTKAACIDVGFDHNRMFEPEQAILAGTAYLALQIKQFGLAGGIRSYYEGAGNRRRNSDNDPTNDRPERALESAEYLSKAFAYQTAFIVNPTNWRIFT